MDGLNNGPPNLIADGASKIADYSLEWSADNRLRILEEWTKRFDSKSEPKPPVSRDLVAGCSGQARAAWAEAQDIAVLSIRMQGDISSWASFSCLRRRSANQKERTINGRFPRLRVFHVEQRNSMAVVTIDRPGYAVSHSPRIGRRCDCRSGMTRWLARPDPFI